MPEIDSGNLTRTRTTAFQIAIWGTVALVMALLALANPLNRDEAQFVAPAADPAGLRVFVDFLYLQTPLQAQLSAPLVRLFPGFGFLAMRIATGLIGAAILALVYASQRSLSVDRRVAAGCTALLVCCYSFQFGSSVVRNDALPALLATAAIFVALWALQGKAWTTLAWCAVGILLGAATSTKISYALPAAGVGLFLIVELVRRRIPVQALVVYIVGGLLGLLPCLTAWIEAPETFVYGVFTFPTTAPFQWYAAKNMGWVLSPQANLVITMGVLALGPALAALAVIVRATVANGWARAFDQPEIALLNILIASGLIAALLPTPTNFQYTLPMLPSLFIRLGLEGRRLLQAPGRTSGVLRVLVTVGLVSGAAYGLVTIVQARVEAGVFPAVLVTQKAHWIGERLRAANASGFVSAMSTQIVLDTGYPLDPRFSTGFVVYRSAIHLSDSMLDQIKAIGPQNLTQSLDQKPPAAIIVGVDSLEQALRHYAKIRGYRREASPFGTFELYIR
jgi:hypothetical protein